MLDDVFGNYINNLGYNRKIPMVELVTINKHCREIARIIRKMKKNPSFKKTNNKSKYIFSGYYAPSGILGPNHCRLRRTGNIRYPRTWELHQQLGTFAMVHNLKKALTPHT